MTTIGRNSPCPCGSGEKFKQCCLNKADTRQNDEVPMSIPVDELSLFLKYAGRKGTSSPSFPWRVESIAEMTTEEIFSKLHTFGISIDTDQFMREAPNFHSAEQYSEDWWRRYEVTACGYDEDFPWMATLVLWERLLPEVMNTERLDDTMQEGYTAFEEKDRQRGCTLWLTVWDHLKTRFTPAISSVKDAEQVFNGTQSLFNWCQDLELELGNAGLDDPHFNEECIRYCREFCTLLPDSSSNIIHNMKRTEIVALFRLGRFEEGELASQALIKAYPNEIFAYINRGDLYYWPTKGEWPADFDRAESLYRMALDTAIDDHGRSIVLERLDLLAQTRSDKQQDGIL